jgi:hypothetical protein
MWFSWVADYPGRNDFLGVLLGTGSTNNYGRWSRRIRCRDRDRLGAADGRPRASRRPGGSIVQRCSGDPGHLARAGHSRATASSAPTRTARGSPRRPGVVPMPPPCAGSGWSPQSLRRPRGLGMVLPAARAADPTWHAADRPLSGQASTSASRSRSTGRSRGSSSWCRRSMRSARRSPRCHRRPTRIDVLEHQLSI